MEAALIMLVKANINLGPQHHQQEEDGEAYDPFDAPKVMTEPSQADQRSKERSHPD